MTDPLRIAVTGPCGNIGYSLLFRLASGAVFGPDRPIQLRLLQRDSEQSRQRLKGVMMELQDCAFSCLSQVQACSTLQELFTNAQIVFLIGSAPRGQGMQRADLLAKNGEIFKTQGEALNRYADKNVKVCVVGNPCNTNAYIAMKNAPDLDPRCFSALMRLDQNRAYAQMADALDCPIGELDDIFVWGNHSNSMVPDIRFMKKNHKACPSPFSEEQWLAFSQRVATRGGAVIQARGASSAASAASAALEHMHDWVLGSAGKIVTMAVPSDGSYGIPKGLIFGMPCRCHADGSYEIVQDLPLDESIKKRIEASRDELLAEARTIAYLLP